MADAIEHVIVLMLENRSFDQMLGSLRKVSPEINGVPLPEETSRQLSCTSGSFAQEPTAVFSGPRDPLHEYKNVTDQLQAKNTGFLTDYFGNHPSSTAAELRQVMGYFDVDKLPALHALARNFLVCDCWHASVPGPTWPNRLFVHSGTSLGRVLMPSGIGDVFKTWHWYDQPTIYDRLREVNKSWAIYRDGIPQSMVLLSLHKAHAGGNFYTMEEFDEDVQDPHTFPAYSFIEPRYSGSGENDDHPPVDVRHGQQLIAKVYNALRANEELWQKSMLIVLYDEHGGFYDHVEPPAAVPPDAHQEEYAFDRLGLRIPAVIASPWVKAGVSHELFDHTSILRYLTDKWSLGPLGARTAQANSIGAVLRSQARTDTPKSVPGPSWSIEEGTVESGASSFPESDYQRALIRLADEVEKKVGPPLLEGVSAAEGAVSPLAAAEEKMNRSIAELKRRAGPFTKHLTVGALVPQARPPLADPRAFLAIEEGLFRTRAWEHTEHMLGFVASAPGVQGPLTIIDPRQLAPDPTLRGKPLQITLDRLHVHEYPGSGEHQVMVSFSAEHAAGASDAQPLQFNQMFRVRTGEGAGVVNYPIFAGLRSGAGGLAFRAFTVNVQNKDDERALSFLKSEPFTKGLQLAGVAAGTLAPLTKLGVGLVELLLARNRNVPVQDVYLGLDFSDSPSGARLRTGTYLAVQVGPEAAQHWSWDDWRYDPVRGLVPQGAGLACWNYFVFGVNAGSDAGS